MADPINDGGPAFPECESGEFGPYIPKEQGMSLRDYFAGQALAAHSWRIREPLFGDVASDCYRFADAMLKARAAK